MFFLIAVIRDKPSMASKKFKIDKKVVASMANLALSTPKLFPEKFSEKEQAEAPQKEKESSSKRKAIEESVPSSPKKKLK